MEFTTYTLGEVCSRLSSGKSIKAAEIFPAGSILFMEEMVLEDMLIEATLKENVQ